TSGWSAGTLKPPDSLVTALRLPPVFVLIIVTVAPTIALSEASTRVPEIVPVTVWAVANPHASNRQNNPCDKFDQRSLMEYIRSSAFVYWKVQHKGSEVHPRIGTFIISSRQL